MLWHADMLTCLHYLQHKAKGLIFKYLYEEGANVRHEIQQKFRTEILIKKN